MVGVRDPCDVLVRELPVSPIHHPPDLPRVDEQNLPGPIAERAPSPIACEKPQARRDLGRVEELAGQGHHAVHEVGLDQLLPDLPFSRLVGRHRSVREHESRHSPRREVVDHVLHPGEVRVARRRHAVLPPLVVLQLISSPVGDVEGGIGEDEVCLEIRQPVVPEGVAVLDLPVDPADREVHLRKAPGGVVGLLPEDPDVALPPLPYPPHCRSRLRGRG